MKADPWSPPRCHSGSVFPSLSSGVRAIGHVPTELRPGVALICVPSPRPHLRATFPHVLCVKDEPRGWGHVGHWMGGMEGAWRCLKGRDHRMVAPWRGSA